VGGTLTDRGGDLIIIDDPLKPDDAHSEAKRKGANECFKNTLLSRLDDKRAGAIIIVMQRVHMDDLTCSVTSQSDEWEVLNLPAIAEVDEAIPISDTKVHRRRVGQALSPAREPLPVLEKMKGEVGSDAFSAQPANAGPARRRHDQAPSDQAVCGTAAAQARSHHPVLGYREQRRTGERLFSLHDPVHKPRQAMVSHRCLAEAGRLS
jgi:hypothetical protein